MSHSRCPTYYDADDLNYASKAIEFFRTGSFPPPIPEVTAESLFHIHNQSSSIWNFLRESGRCVVYGASGRLQFIGPPWDYYSHPGNVIVGFINYDPIIVVDKPIPVLAILPESETEQPSPISLSDLIVDIS